MSKASCDIRIGTSGWHYNHWVGPFYPPELPKTKWLQFYAEHFDTVEVNNTFYRLPKESSVKNWYRQAPKNFLYTVKANRYITHIKRLKDASEPLERFLQIAEILEKKLGPVLWQLPPNFHKDLELLQTFLKLLPKKILAVFEFRHQSWFSEDTYEMLNRFNAGFCTHDMPGNPTPHIITGNVIYLRFHGPTGKYAGNYSKSALRDWAKWTKEHIEEVRSVYAYFNNDIHGHAIQNAKTLKEQF